jgi:hypothetical protein
MVATATAFVLGGRGRWWVWVLFAAGFIVIVLQLPIVTGFLARPWRWLRRTFGVQAVRSIIYPRYRQTFACQACNHHWNADLLVRARQDIIEGTPVSCPQCNDDGLRIDGEPVPLNRPARRAERARLRAQH